MPRTPAWIKNLHAIKALAQASQAFAFDRAAVSQMFHVSQRQAAHLLDHMGAERVGGAFIVPRERLLAYLDGRALDDPGQAERQRRQQLAEKLAEIRAAGPPLRAVRAAVAAPPSSLPAGVAVTGPGQIKIQFDPRSPGTVLGAILSLAELAESHPAAFAASLAYHSPEGAEEENE